MNALEILSHGVEYFINTQDLEKKLAKNRPLKIKLGVDPTRPDLTFGHMVVFNKLRQFQDLGHEAILLIGDYTATIGDPSGRSETRPVLTQEEVNKNSETYLAQAFRILDKNKTTVVRNSEWLKDMTLDKVLNLTRKMTVARMLERDDFAKRYNENRPISIIEFLYPLMQGYDSVVLEADVELGGSDQLFNLLVGRSLQKDFGQEEQIVMTMPLLVGLDGKRKMSKSYDNYIAFNHSSKDMFGRIMSIPDYVMWTYFKLLLSFSDEQIEELKTQHPMHTKKFLASTLVTKFFSQDIANQELKNFESVFSHNEIPEEMTEIKFDTLATKSLIDVIYASEMFESKKEIRRMIEQGAVKINGERIDLQYTFEEQNMPLVVQCGKRIFFRLV